MTYLPDELLFQVLQILTDEASLAIGDVQSFNLLSSTLASLCLASKNLCAVSQPFLYRNIVKPKSTSKPDLNDSELKQTTQLEKLIRTLIHRPDLAKNVESLTLDAPQSDKDSEDSDFEDLTLDPELGDLFETASNTLPQPLPENEEKSRWRESWRAELRCGLDDAEVALLLALVPNLRALDITSYEHDLGTYVDDLCREFLGPINIVDGDEDVRSPPQAPPVIFSCLESLTIRGRETSEDDDTAGDILSLEPCVNIMALPTLRNFTAHRVQELDAMLIGSGINSRLPLSHIAHVKLFECEMHCLVIQNLLDSCNKLQSLQISFGGTEIDVGDEFLEYLHESRDTLERLSLLLPQSFSSMTFASPFDLLNLHKVKYLEMTQHPLVPRRPGWRNLPQYSHLADDEEKDFPDLLPASIEELILRACNQDIGTHLEALLESIKDFPKLRVLVVDFRYTGRWPRDRQWDPQEFDDVFSRITAGFEEAGLDVIIFHE